MPKAQTFGKHLGCPIHHQRPNKQTCQSIIDRIKLTLSGWKARTLSLAILSTLIQAVTLALPDHIMNVNYLPKCITSVVDKVNRDFLWGSTGDQRKIHALNWENVSKPKKNWVVLGSHSLPDSTKLKWLILIGTLQLVVTRCGRVFSKENMGIAVSLTPDLPPLGGSMKHGLDIHHKRIVRW